MPLPGAYMNNFSQLEAHLAYKQVDLTGIMFLPYFRAFLVGTNYHTVAEI